MGRRVRLLCVGLLLLLSTTGCWDRREVNDLAIVLATAVDKVEEGYRVAVQLPLPRQVGGSGRRGGGSSDRQAWYISEATGRSISEAKSNEQKELPRQLYFAHRRIFIMGAEIARAGVAPLVDILARIPQNRMSTLMVVAKGDALDVLTVDTPVEQFPAEVIRELVQGTIREPWDIKRFLTRLLAEGIDPIGPVVGVSSPHREGAGPGTSTVRVEGIAVFAHDRLAGILDQEESEGLLWALGQSVMPGLTVQAPEDGEEIGLQLTQSSADLTVSLKDGRVQALVRIQAVGSVRENTSRFSAAHFGNLPLIEEIAARLIQKRVRQAVTAIQQEYGSDALGVGDAVRRSFPRVWQQMRRDWRTHYQKAEVTVEVSVHLEHTGTLMRPAGRPDREVER